MSETLVGDVAIVGAGAAGLACAIFAARTNPRLRILVLDGAQKVGAKILVAGGGRCNVTNARVTPADYWGGSSNTVRKVLSAFSERQTVEFFRELGVRLHEEPVGKMFPDSNRARDILDALLAELERLGGRLLTGRRVQDIRPEAGGFELSTPREPVRAARAVLSTGGLSLPKTGSDGGGYTLARALGHSLTPTTPALAPLVLDGDFHAGLSGVAQEVELSIIAERTTRIRGAMLWTHFGVSGPAALDTSRHWLRAMLEGREPRITANLLPGRDFQTAEQELIHLASAQPRTTLRHALATWIPARVAEAILERIGIPGQTPLAHLPRESRRKLLLALLAWPLPVRDSRGYAYAEVTAGGVPLSEINPASMESRRCAGLHLVGEILDVDGRIGGFNFQWAWASGYVCGRAIGGAA